MRRPFRILERAFALVGVVLVFYHVAFDVGYITSGSMQPTLSDGDYVLVEKLSKHIHQPRRWDIVSFHTNDGLQVMKRVVGLPGETVSIARGVVQIDGSAVPRPQSLRSLTYYAYGNLTGGASSSAADGYYVLGDDSQDSQDSRFEGPVPARRVLGRVWLIVWPAARVGWVR